MSTLSIQLNYHHHRNSDANRVMMINEIDRLLADITEEMDRLEITIDFQPHFDRERFRLCPQEFILFDVLNDKISLIAPQIKHLSLSIILFGRIEHNIVANNLQLLQDFPHHFTSIESLDISIQVIETEEDLGYTPNYKIYEALMQFLCRFEQRQQLKYLSLDLENMMANDESHSMLTERFLMGCEELTEIQLRNISYIAQGSIVDLITEFIVQHQKLKIINIEALSSNLSLINLAKILNNPHLERISWASFDRLSYQFDSSLFLKTWALFAQNLAKASRLAYLVLNLEEIAKPPTNPEFYELFYRYFCLGLIKNHSLLEVEISYEIKFHYLSKLSPYLLQIGKNSTLQSLSLARGSIPRLIDGLSTRLEDLRASYAMAQAQTEDILREMNEEELPRSRP